jgi:CheY-specific phosphatase CheX
MTSVTETPLFRAAASTFEDLAFLMPTDGLDERQSSSAPEAEARVDFTGPFAGSLTVRTYGPLLAHIAANMLGVDGASEGMQLDALGEIANVLCGNVLPLVAGSGAVFDLRAPRVTRLHAAPSPAATASATHLSLGIGEGRVEVTLAMEEGAAA